MVGLTAERNSVEITPELTLRDLDRCRAWAACSCGRTAEVRPSSLIARYGIDAKVADLVPRLFCRKCELRGRARLDIERQTGPYRPSGNQPHYF